ncbi:MAG: hypothetical protein KAT26_12560 [Marinosulfonomonas sp.]|nr:hypothetical protein [Marinosulfonomonas sp.]
MKFTDGVEQALLERDLPIITYYDFFVLGHKLFTRRVWDGEPLKRMPQGWDRTRANNAIKRMEERRALVSDSDFRSGVWRVTQSTRAGSAEEVVCIADPFAYVSHLSAMQKYSFTDRSPKALHLTTPRRDIWSNLRNERVRDDLPDIDVIEKPILNRPGFKDIIRRRPVIVHISSHPWTPVSVSGEETRITSIGQTFADMLSEPGLCGGMRHVLDVWERAADQWVPDIIEAIDQLGSKIAKVRAGYILSEVLDLDHPAIKRWEEFAQRGGSRKLDPEGEYVPEFSERWMISLNV